MVKYHKNFFYAVAMMIGYIIGVGMFSLPYITSKAGVFAFFCFLIGIGLVQYLVHLIYANIIIVTHNYHAMPGYVGQYLGKPSKYLVFAAKLIGNYGALLAYIIITAIFLKDLFAPLIQLHEYYFATFLFIIQALVVFFGMRTIAKFELLLTGFLILVIILLVARGIPVIKLSNYSFVDLKYFLLPFGAMLFALDGNGSLPVVARLLKRDKQAIKKTIRWAMAFAVIIILIFTLSIVGISGDQTTPDALTGIKSILKNGIVMLALIFGIITMVTSFIGVAEDTREIFWWDFKFNKHVAWAMAVFVPFILYLIGMRNLIEIVSFAGAVAGGICAILLMLVFCKLKKQRNKLVLYKYKPSNFLIYFIILIFCFFIVNELYYFF